MQEQDWELINTTKMDQNGQQMLMNTYQKGENRMMTVSVYEQDEICYIQLMPQDMSSN